MCIRSSSVSETVNICCSQFQSLRPRMCSSIAWPQVSMNLCMCVIEGFESCTLHLCIKLVLFDQDDIGGYGKGSVTPQMM